MQRELGFHERDGATGDKVSRSTLAGEFGYDILQKGADLLSVHQVPGEWVGRSYL